MVHSAPIKKFEEKSLAGFALSVSKTVKTIFANYAIYRATNSCANIVQKDKLKYPKAVQMRTISNCFVEMIALNLIFVLFYRNLFYFRIKIFKKIIKKLF